MQHNIGIEVTGHPVHTICRYHKYKGRFTDLAQAYKDLEAENQKVKDVMQQTQVRDSFKVDL